MQNIDEKKILVAGFAQLPKGTPLFEIQKLIGCILVINSETNIIEKATFTFIQDLTNDFAASLIIGRSIIDDVEKITKDIEQRLLIQPQKATLQAIISARTRYLDEKI